MFGKLFSTFAALMFSSIAAFAGTPEISGDYAINLLILCQAGTALYSGSGLINPQWLTGNFNHKTGKVNLIGTQMWGPITLTSPGASQWTPGTVSEKNYAYSNGATTLTISGLVFNVVYGPVNSSGIATSFVFGGEAFSQCAWTATAIRQ